MTLLKPIPPPVINWFCLNVLPTYTQGLQSSPIIAHLCYLTTDELRHYHSHVKSLPVKPFLIESQRIDGFVIFGVLICVFLIVLRFIFNSMVTGLYKI